MQRIKAILISLLMVGSLAGHAQEEETEYQHFKKCFVKNLRIPRDISQSGDVNLFLVLIKVNKGKIADTLFFSDNTPSSLRSEVQSLYNLFATTKWEKIFPGAADKKDCTIIYPIYYCPMDGSEKFDVSRFGNVVEKAFSITSMKSSYFILPPSWWTYSAPQPFRLSQ